MTEQQTESFQEIWRPEPITDAESDELDKFLEEHLDIGEVLDDVTLSGAQIATEHAPRVPQLETCEDGAFVVGVRLDEERFVGYRLVPVHVYRRLKVPRGTPDSD